MELLQLKKKKKKTLKEVLDFYLLLPTDKEAEPLHLWIKYSLFNVGEFTLFIKVNNDSITLLKSEIKGVKKLCKFMVKTESFTLSIRELKEYLLNLEKEI